MKSYLQGFASKKQSAGLTLNQSEKFSVLYHDIFEYPLTFEELIKWTAKNPPQVATDIGYKNGLYFIQSREGLVYKRMVRKRFSQRKMKIAKKASGIISLLPGVLMVGVSGSLAMGNAKKRSDIDLLIITKKGRLWTTRLIAYLLLKLFGLSLRSPMNLKEEDKLCLNIWLDESDLTWSKNDKNFYTAHEILQTLPLINKKGTYERYLYQNRWAFNFWPNAVDNKLIKNNSSPTKLVNLNPIENLAFKMQYSYMKSKITREVVKPTRAIFHPRNLSREVVAKYT